MQNDWESAQIIITRLAEIQKLFEEMSFDTSAQIATAQTNLTLGKEKLSTLQKFFVETKIHENIIAALGAVNNGYLKGNEVENRLTSLYEDRKHFEQLSGLKKLLELRKDPPLSFEKLEIKGDVEFPLWLTTALEVKGAVNRLLDPAAWESNLQQAEVLFYKLKNSPELDDDIKAQYEKTIAARGTKGLNEIQAVAGIKPTKVPE